MKKKFICAVCGYIYEGAEAPEKCPICKAPASKFSELKEDGETTYATVHKIGDGKLPGADEEMINDLRNHFNGECKPLCRAAWRMCLGHKDQPREACRSRSRCL